MRIVLIILTLCFSLSVAGQEVQLSWKKDLNIATELAKSENKPILIYFTKSDCSACSQFYSDFFKSENFKTVSNDFILLMLDSANNDVDNTDFAVIKQRRLVLHYNNTLTFPAVLLVDSDRQELGPLFTSTDKTAIANYMNTLKTIK